MVIDRPIRDELYDIAETFILQRLYKFDAGKKGNMYWLPKENRRMYLAITHYQRFLWRNEIVL